MMDPFDYSIFIFSIYPIAVHWYFSLDWMDASYLTWNKAWSAANPYIYYQFIYIIILSIKWSINFFNKTVVYE